MTPPTPRADNLWLKSVKLIYFKKKILLYFLAWIGHTKYYTYEDKGSKFHYPRIRASYARALPLKSHSKNVLFL